MEYKTTKYGRTETNAKGFVKYYPNIKLRVSSLDTFVMCPKQSQVPFNMDVFTANIGHMLHFAHQFPGFVQTMIDTFMKEYREVTGEAGNELRDMLTLYIKRGADFIDTFKGCIIIYEAPLIKTFNTCRAEGHPDVIIIDYKGTYEEFYSLSREEKNKYDMFVLDFKSSQSPGTFEGSVDTSKPITKAQPYFYSRMACEMVGMDRVTFQYFVYSKGKTVKFHMHGALLELEELVKITDNIIDDYESSYYSGIWEKKKGNHCFMCPLGPKGDKSCV